MKTYLWYAQLENSHSIECTGKQGCCDLRIGEIVNTQWGPRKVIDLYSLQIDTRQTEPYGC